MEGHPGHVRPGSEFSSTLQPSWEDPVHHQTSAFSLSDEDIITEAGQVFNHLAQSLAHQSECFLFYRSLSFSYHCSPSHLLD